MSKGGANSLKANWHKDLTQMHLCTKYEDNQCKILACSLFLFHFLWSPMLSTCTKLWPPEQAWMVFWQYGNKILKSLLKSQWYHFKPYHCKLEVNVTKDRCGFSVESYATHSSHCLIHPRGSANLHHLYKGSSLSSYKDDRLICTDMVEQCDWHVCPCYSNTWWFRRL